MSIKKAKVIFAISIFILIVTFLAANASEEGKTSISPIYKIPKNEINNSITSSFPPQVASYYITILGTKSQFIMDQSGKKVSPFIDMTLFSKMPQEEQVKQMFFGNQDLADKVSINVIGEEGADYIVSDEKEFTIMLESQDSPIMIEAYYGYGDPKSALLAMKYLDLPIIKYKMRLLTNSEGITPLMVDENSDGIYEKRIEPTAILIGKNNIDVIPPIVSFKTEIKDNYTIVILEAKDDKSGVKKIFYSFDEKNFKPYSGPFELKPRTACDIYVFADDYAGNRSYDDFKIP